MLLEHRSIGNLYCAARATNRAGRFEGCQRLRYPGAPNAQHHRKDIMSDRDDVAVETIVREQQPPRQTFLKLVSRIAECKLRVLYQEKMHVVQQRWRTVRSRS